MARNPKFDVVGVIDRRAGHAEAIAADHELRNWARSDSLHGVPWLDKVDAITIGSAPFSHHKLISEALALGKHVLTEKPFTMTADEADDLIVRRDAAEKTLCVVHNFQFARSMQQLMTDLQAGELGKIQSLSAVQFGNPARRLPTWYEDLPLGLFYDESPHLLYLLKRLAPGALTLQHAAIHGSTRGDETPASITAHYGFDVDGTSYPATLSCNFESPVSEWYVMVFGSERLGIVDVFRDIYVSLPNDGLHVTQTVIRTSVTATWQHWLQTVISGIGHLRGRLFYGNETVFDRFADAVLHGKTPTGITAEDARAVQRMQQDIIERGMRMGGQS